MFERDDESRERFPGELNGPQRNRLLSTCQHIDKLLSSVEHILHETASESPFRTHIVDIAPAQTRVIEDYIRRLRRQLLRALEWQHMKPAKPEIPATRAVLTNLAFVDIAVEELRPHYMRGSGDVPEDATDELNGVVHELRSLVEEMERYLRQELSIDLESRLQKLEKTGYDLALLRRIEQIVTRQGLVEFRSRIASLAERLEDHNLEVAFFGRVSSGKSSLLNALLETDVLPVGVNPITAVPTKLRYGSKLRVEVTYGSGRSELIAVEQLADVVTERGNPGNLRNVVKTLVDVPSSRLQKGIVLVDTPGLGSLARKGAAETLAYLPACDLALLLIDAGNTLNEEDIGTLRLLYEAGIPSLVLLSKADLLARGERQEAIAYVVEQIQSELGIMVQVHPVSCVPAESDLLERFFEEELLPRFGQAQTLREASVARKIGTLKDSVMAALDTILNRQSREAPEPAVDPAGLESQLRVATGEMGELGRNLSRAFLELGESSKAVMDSVVERGVGWYELHPGDAIAGRLLDEWIRDAVGERLNSQIGHVREVVERTVLSLQGVAEGLRNDEIPSAEELESGLRDLPRFELAELPGGVGAGGWRWLGRRAVRSALHRGLQENAGSMLQEALRRYGYALREWSDRAIARMDAVVRSYADTYRAQIHRMTGMEEQSKDRGQVQRDLESLRNWRAGVNTDIAAQRA
jgi:GTP-binding protein EngB required for normal cell division